MCIDYCRDDFVANVKFIHPRGGKAFKDNFKSSSGVNDQDFKFNDESSLQVETVLANVAKIRNN